MPPPTIAVTGGLGSGKSTVTTMVATLLGAARFDADAVCRDELTPGRHGYRQFVAGRGAQFVEPDGQLDRRRLRAAVFQDRELKKELEGILHPLARQRIMELAAACREAQQPVVVEVPLLYEVGWQDDYDLCVVVVVPAWLCAMRAAGRDGVNVEETMAIIGAQLPIADKAAWADLVIDNSTTYASTFLQVNRAAREIVRFSCGKRR